MSEELEEFEFTIVTMYETKSTIKIKAKNYDEAHKKAQSRDFLEHHLTLVETNYTGTRVYNR